LKKSVKNFLNKLPYIKGLHTSRTEFIKNSCYPPGHYYSPIVSVDEIKANEAAIWKDKLSDNIKDIDLNVDGQKGLIRKFIRYYDQIPFTALKIEELRYYYENDMYSYTDGIILYSMMRYISPKKIVEVGSGHSSALMLDVNQLFFDNTIELTFIEPYPERLFENISERDKKSVTIIEKKIQDVDVSYFETLDPGDILFIDSTHVSKTGSDVNFIFFEILPKLKPGVFIHFHDIFYPFEYPKGWVYGGRNWNENYFLRAFLMNNNDYAIRLFPHYLHLHHAGVFESMPLSYKNKGGNIWLEKLR
jgi:predicted O-methyltransferase YrrM